MPSQKWVRVKRAYDYLVGNEGALVTKQQIASAAGWTVGTVGTYATKRWAGVLEPQLDSSTYRVSGVSKLTWSDFKLLHSQVVVPPRAIAPKVFDYDVAFSFAGEDRAFVGQVADVVQAYGIKVFYDAYEQHTLWGRDLYSHLDEVYRTRSRHCVMFLSKHYARKLWTSHERRSAQARALLGREDYILPVRFDDTDIDGILPTTGFIDARTYSAQEVANLISTKLGRNGEMADLIATMAAHLGPAGYTISQVGTNLKFECERESYQNQMSIAMLLEAMRAGQLEHYFLHSSIFVQ
jgi:hypothetical protein